MPREGSFARVSNRSFIGTPNRNTPQLESLERTLAHGRDLLTRYPDDRSQERKEFERSLESLEETLREERYNWPTLRAHILREAGVEYNEES